MTAVRLTSDLEERLSNLSEQTKRSKSFYMKEALQEYLDEHEELLLALAVKERIQQGKEKLYTLDEAKKFLGLENDIH
ncbi:ribbon-helix-helix protein, CopG family [Alphaproteobacteria bacterium]|nr:ribbon-helix-helix protein, CopG family [Alphaproteobacteria bacterium]